MKIEWVNHASYVLESGGVRLLVDPWLDGRVFDSGWELLSPSRFRPEDFARVTHLWFSHEHPDHFHPPTLQKVPAEARARVQVLFQKTRDHKVADYCRKLGFPVSELEPGEWRPLGGGVELRCDPARFWGDSWSAVRAEGLTVLNLNDCAFTAKELEAMKASLGRVDVLLMQFSYASWCGNPGDSESRRRRAEEILRSVAEAARLLQPRFLVPFASFVRFCHPENAYMNDRLTPAGEARARLGENTASKIVVLYPGDVWTVGEPHDSDAAVRRYEADAREERPLAPAVPVPFDELLNLGRRFAGRMARLNPTLYLLRLKPARFFVRDWGRSLELTPFGAREAALPERACDMSVGSSALAYAFRFLWGGDTLFVNGRYELPPEGDPERLWPYFQIASLNNRGGRYSGFFVRMASKIKNFVSRGRPVSL